jgi:Sulfotransferase family
VTEEQEQMDTTFIRSELPERQATPPVMEPNAQPSKVKIVFVTGAAGRSGTTLVARLLGEIEGCVNIGEGQYLFDSKTRQEDAPCGCGNLVQDCPFWAEIEESVPDKVQEFAGRYVRTRNSPFLLMRYRRGPFAEKFREFLSTLETTYLEIARRTNCGVVVTTTKSPWYLFALTQLSKVEVYVVHLVRSPEGVVKSWSKRKNYSAPQAALKILGEWSLHNLLFEVFGRRAHAYWRICFEDLPGNPQGILKSIADGVFQRPVVLPFTSPNRARVHTQHILVSNPDKLTGDEIIIRPAPQNSLPLGKRMLVKSLAFPLLWRYGYLGQRRP